MYAFAAQRCGVDHMLTQPGRESMPLHKSSGTGWSCSRRLDNLGPNLLAYFRLRRHEIVAGLQI